MLQIEARTDGTLASCGAKGFEFSAHNYILALSVQLKIGVFAIKMTKRSLFYR